MGHDVRGTVPRTVALAGYYAAGDGNEHVIAAGDDGTITELFWRP
jgi:hypothetical protein